MGWLSAAKKSNSYLMLFIGLYAVLQEIFPSLFGDFFNNGLLGGLLIACSIRITNLYKMLLENYAFLLEDDEE